jgi:hypothetical protein
MYIDIDYLVKEGLTEAAQQTSRATMAIQMAQQYIEKMTEQFFEKTVKTLLLDGEGTSTILLPIFCIDITTLKIHTYNIYGVPEWEDIDPEDAEDYVLYNRFFPDDRVNPKIEMTFDVQKGKQNIQIIGNFGYVESDESTPLLIKKICAKLAMHEFEILMSSDRGDDRQRARILEEKTDGHSYKLGECMIAGIYTGDPEIDSVLIHYKRPIQGVAI